MLTAPSTQPKPATMATSAIDLIPKSTSLPAAGGGRWMSVFILGLLSIVVFLVARFCIMAPIEAHVGTTVDFLVNFFGLPPALLHYRSWITFTLAAFAFLPLVKQVVFWVSAVRWLCPTVREWSLLLLLPMSVVVPHTLLAIFPPQRVDAKVAEWFYHDAHAPDPSQPRPRIGYVAEGDGSLSFYNLASFVRGIDGALVQPVTPQLRRQWLERLRAEDTQAALEAALEAAQEAAALEAAQEAAAQDQKRREAQQRSQELLRLEIIARNERDRAIAEAEAEAAAARLSSVAQVNFDMLRIFSAARAVAKAEPMESSSRRRQRVVKASSVTAKAPAQLPSPQPSSASSAMRVPINCHSWAHVEVSEGPIEVRSEGGSFWVGVEGRQPALFPSASWVRVRETPLVFLRASSASSMVQIRHYNE